MSCKNEWSPERIAKVRHLIPCLYELVGELNEEFALEKRKFTPDGHMVGSIGEVIAAYAFDLNLLPSSTKNHDASTMDGKLVQIKLTGGRTVGWFSMALGIWFGRIAERSKQMGSVRLG